MCGNTRRIFARVAKLREPAKYNETLYIVRLGANTKSHSLRLEIIKSPGVVIEPATGTTGREFAHPPARFVRSSSLTRDSTAAEKRSQLSNANTLADNRADNAGWIAT